MSNQEATAQLAALRATLTPWPLPIAVITSAEPEPATALASALATDGALVVAPPIHKQISGLRLAGVIAAALELDLVPTLATFAADVTVIRDALREHSLLVIDGLYDPRVPSVRFLVELGGCPLLITTTRLTWAQVIARQPSLDSIPVYDLDRGNVLPTIQLRPPARQTDALALTDALIALLCGDTPVASQRRDGVALALLDWWRLPDRTLLTLLPTAAICAALRVVLPLPRKQDHALGVLLYDAGEREVLRRVISR